MREFITIVETAQQGVGIDMLPRSVKADILDMCLGPNGPPAFEQFWEKTHGIMSFDETYVSQFLFGEEDLDIEGEYNGDTIKVNLLELDPRVLYSERRSVSDLVVGQYAARTTRAPPVLVRQTAKGWKLVEGGHRIAAAVQRGDKAVQAVDVTAFFNMSVEDWENL